MKRRSFILFVALVLLLTACAGQVANNEVTPTPFPTPLRPTFTVQRGDITVEAKLSGRELLMFFRELVEKQNITALIVSHDSLVDQYVHQVLTLQDGIVVA